MELQETRKILNSFAKYVIQQAKSNLTKRKKNVSKSLYNSLDYKILQDSSGSILQFLMEEYGAYQDQGVSGTKKKYNTPFKYKSKGGKRGLKGMPPTAAIDKWAVRKSGLDKKVRDKKGRFIPRKSLVFLIAKSIFEKGIKPSLFFTKPFEKRFQTLPNDLIAAFVNDAEKTIEDGNI
tara:strand:- start:9026 stop:9559 length:534 start_codon:yes stop_codon:yes gene_type:complete